MMRLACLLLGLALPALAFAKGGVGAAEHGVEMSMVVTGTIAVDPDGGVYAWTLDRQEKLPPAVIEVVKAIVPAWKFKPVLVDGKPVLAKTRMSLRIVAQPLDAQHWSVRIAGAAFGRYAGRARTRAECPPGACIEFNQRRRPRYPVDMGVDGVGGTVYLVQEIGRDGHVIRQAVRQVDLRRTGETTRMAFWRHEFAQASLEAAKDWTYRVPTTGTAAANDHWVVRVPIDYALLTPNRPLPHSVYGQWEVYVPGPVQDIPWLKENHGVGAPRGSPDAISGGGAPFMADARFVLKTPIGNAAGKSWPANHADSGG
ncbi:MAG: energy transducer TonB [Rhodanobacteraceae bacterium]